jgi:hypothetical protein
MPRRGSSSSVFGNADGSFADDRALDGGAEGVVDVLVEDGNFGGGEAAGGCDFGFGAGFAADDGMAAGLDEGSATGGFASGMEAGGSGFGSGGGAIPIWVARRSGDPRGGPRPGLAPTLATGCRSACPAPAPGPNPFAVAGAGADATGLTDAAIRFGSTLALTVRSSSPSSIAAGAPALAAVVSSPPGAVVTPVAVAKSGTSSGTSSSTEPVYQACHGWGKHAEAAEVPSPPVSGLLPLHGSPRK